jgi:hypothetical protein
VPNHDLATHQDRAENAGRIQYLETQIAELEAWVSRINTDRDNEVQRLKATVIVLQEALERVTDAAKSYRSDILGHSSEQLGRYYPEMAHAPKWTGRDASISMAETAIQSPTVQQVRDEIEELRADRARLDWLERKGFSTSQDGKADRDYGVHCWKHRLGHADEEPDWKWTARWISSSFTDARAAIDAARSKDTVAKDGANES